jgi:hypothetical protein
LRPASGPDSKPSGILPVRNGDYRFGGREPMPDNLAKRTQGKSTPGETNPTNPSQRSAADAIFVGLTRRDPVTPARFGRTNPTGTSQLASIPPNLRDVMPAKAGIQ